MLLNPRHPLLVDHKRGHKKPRAESTKAGGRANTLRIIGGEWRGRKLAFPDAQGLRPTGDRIRETLFNWLMAEVPGARCLDLFAGAGALGLEALSRGAREVVMIDQNPAVTDQLRQHLLTLGSDNGTVVQANALSWLTAATNRKPAERFDIVFIDPPFDRQLWQPAIQQLEAPGLLRQQAAIYIETPVNTTVAVPTHWRLHREKRAGQVCFRLYYSLTTNLPAVGLDATGTRRV